MATSDGESNPGLPGSSKRDCPLSASKTTFQSQSPKPFTAASTLGNSISHPPVTPNALFGGAAGSFHAPVQPAGRIANSSEKIPTAVEENFKGPIDTAMPSSRNPFDPSSASPGEESNLNQEGDLDPEWDPDLSSTVKKAAIDAAMEAFQIHDRNAATAITEGDKQRIVEILRSKDEEKLVMTHSLVITVLPSVNLSAGNGKGKLAQKGRSNPTSKDFQKDLESMLLQIACLKQQDIYEFDCTKKCYVKHGIPSIAKYELKFQSRTPIARILSANQSVFKKDFTLKYFEKKLDLPPPFPGDVYHLPKLRDLASNKNLDLGSYIDQLCKGGMNPAAFTGIKTGDTVRTDNIGVKIHKHVEVYFDPTMTANHGSQEVRDPGEPGSVINLEEEFGVCIPVPKHKILEPPSYIAWMDSTGYIHKRELRKSGNWCQYCWGPAHEPGFKCVYFNFCKACLAFNPRQSKFKQDFALNRHLCNYGVTEMPDQKVPVGPAETVKEQVYTEERRAKIAQLEEQAKKANSAAEAALEAKKLNRKRMIELIKAKGNKKHDKKKQRRGPP